MSLYVNLPVDNLEVQDRADLKGEVHATALPTHADNTEATAAGLAVGRFYKTATGAVMVVVAA